MRRGFNPVVDGVVLPQHPYYPDAAPAAVSMLSCSTFNEQELDGRLARERHARRGRRDAPEARNDPDREARRALPTPV